MYVMNYINLILLTQLVNWVDLQVIQVWIIERQLKRYTLGYRLYYIGYPTILKEYGNDNWKSNIKNLKSTSEYVFSLSEAAVLWKSFKQICITRSKMELEFIALDKIREEAKWIQNFLEDILYWLKSMPTICIYYNSYSAIRKAQSSMYNESLDI